MWTNFEEPLALITFQPVGGPVEGKQQVGNRILTKKSPKSEKLI